MNIDFLRLASCPTLELFFAGWGMDSRPFAWAADSPHTAHCDFAVCYDYSDMTLDAEALRPYSEVRVRHGRLAYTRPLWSCRACTVL